MHPNDGRVVSNFILQALRREPISVYGDGTRARSFCYVSDWAMVDGVVRLMQSPREVWGPIAERLRPTIDYFRRFVR